MGALERDVDGHEPCDEARPAVILEERRDVALEGLFLERTKRITLEHPAEIVIALVMRSQVAALRSFVTAAVAEQLRQQHRQVLRAAEAGIAPLAVQRDIGLGRHLAEQDRIRNGERIADRIVESAHRVIERASNEVRADLDDAMLHAAMSCDQGAPLQLVGVVVSERDGVADERRVVKPRRQSDDQAGVEASGQQGGDRSSLREPRGHRVLERGPKLAGQRSLVELRVLARLCGQIPETLPLGAPALEPQALAG